MGARKGGATTLVLKCLLCAIVGALLGFLAYLGAGLALYAVVGLVTGDSEKGAAAFPLAIFLVPTGVLIGVIVPIRAEAKQERERRREAEAAENARREHHSYQQDSYRREIRSLTERSLAQLEAVPGELDSAERWLDQAEAHFAEGAFAPFWDSVESAARTLGSFVASVREIKAAAERYTEVLKVYEGLPSMFPVSPESVRSLSLGARTAERMQAVVRKTRIDFQFSVIYEQRKNNQLLVADFTSLGQALSSMTWQITASIDALAGSLKGLASALGESPRAAHSRLRGLEEAATRSMAELSTYSSEAAAREKKVVEMLESIGRERRL